MSWHQIFSFGSELSLPFVALFGSSTSRNIVPTKTARRGALLALRGPIIGVVFQTQNEGQGFSVEIVRVQLQGTGFDDVSLTFSHSMLTGEAPGRTVPSPFCVAIGSESEIANLPEILCEIGFTLVLAAVLRAPFMNCWQ